MSGDAALLIGCGAWRDHRFRGGEPAIPCVPFSVTLLGLVGSVLGWALSGQQLAFLPLCLLGGDDGGSGGGGGGDGDGYCLSPLQALGLVTWTVQSRLWRAAERELTSATQGGGAGNFSSVRSLVRTGQYGFCRNPLYLATLALFFPSIAVLCNSAWFAAIGTPLQLLNYSCIVVPAEEALLERQFGDEFRSYRDEVGRWSPWC